jgi:hypothetical protein
MFTETSTYRLGFRCAGCDAAWHADYEIRTARFTGGTEIQTFYRDGFAVASPVRSARCVSCGTPRSACCEVAVLRND